MTKRYWMRALCAAMVMCLLISGALAQGGSIMPQRGANDTYLRVSDVAVVGEEVFFLVYSGESMALWRWREGMEQAEQVAHGLMRGDNLNQGQQFPREDARMKYAVSILVSDGERLLSVNPGTGLVFAMALEGEQLVCTDVVTLADTDVFYRRSRTGSWYAGATATAVSGDYLYWLGDGWDEATGSNRPRIVRYSLLDGSAMEIPAADTTAVAAGEAGVAITPSTFATTLCAYPDGMLCILGRPQEDADGEVRPYVVSLYNPADGSVTPVAEIDTTRAVHEIAYVPVLDSIIWQEGTNILGMQAMGPEQLYAYVPTSTAGDMAVLDDMLILSLSGQTFVRPLVPGLTVPESLQVMHGSFDKGAVAFTEAYPDVPLEMINKSVGEDGYGPWLTPADGSNRVDVLRLYTTGGNDRDFVNLRDQGLLLDLSSDPAIVAYVDTLYPPFRALVTGENGEIWAVPTETVSYTGFFVNRKAMQDMGFTPEDMPTNMIELCAFINMWDEEYADRFPNYCCIEYSENTRKFLTDMAIDMWIAHCQATGREILFDDPEFRRVLAAVGSVSTVRTDRGMQVTNPEISDYKSGLFWVDCQLVGNWAPYMEDYSDRIFIPLTLTENTPFHAGVEGVELWVVNSGTESPDYAMKYVSGRIPQVNDKYAHVLQSTRTEPVESPYYAESLASANRELGDLQLQLLHIESPEEAASLEKRIREQEAYMNGDLLRQKYTIAPSAVDNYVSVIAPAMYIERWNVLQHTSEGVNSREYIRDRWLNGVIDDEQFIREMDTRLLMLEMAQP